MQRNDAPPVPWNSMELLVSSKLAHQKFLGIPWNCSCHQIGALEFPWNSIEFHGTARVIEIGALLIPWNSKELLVSSILAHSKFHGIPWNCWCQFHGIPWNLFLLFNGTIGSINTLSFQIPPRNLSFQILMKIIFNCAGWINFRKLINTLYLFASLFHQLMFYYQYLHYTICISGITHYASK